jgi:hypothetical protein
VLERSVCIQAIIRVLSAEYQGTEKLRRRAREGKSRVHEMSTRKGAAYGRSGIMRNFTVDCFAYS